MENIRKVKWIEDIEQLMQELPKRHLNLFHTVDKESFYKKIEDLKNSIDILDNYELQVEIGKIVASIKEAHTYVNMHVRYVSPFELYWFDDGLYVISTLLDYKDLLGGKIVAINDIAIEKIIDEISTIISFENQYYFKSLIPKYLPAVEILYGLNIIDDIKILKVIYENQNGELKNINITSQLTTEFNENQKLRVEKLNDVVDLPLYRQKEDLNYWFKYIDKDKILYFKYNKCREMDNKKINEFIDSMICFIEDNEIEKLVIDLRNNSGGNSALLDPLIEYLANNHNLNKEGRLFVIIGRETFSSALLNALSLKDKTKALFLGEPTGGKPNCYGEVEKFTLKNYGLTIFYSTQYYDVIGDDSVMTLIPDVEIKLSLEDYINLVDPILEYINK